MRKINLLAYACGWGAKDRDCKDGPLAMRLMGLADVFKQEAFWSEVLHADHKLEQGSDLAPKDAFPLVKLYTEMLYKQTKEALESGCFPITIGGDHSMAMGSWPAIVEYYKAQNKCGLIWFDAHMDAHTPESSQSGAYHGMPLACLLGHGENKLVNIGMKGASISPEHCCLIGVRSFEKGEEKLLKDLGVLVFTMQDIKEKGLKRIFNKAKKHVLKGADIYGISIDLDAIDPKDAPGIGSPESNGIKKDDLITVLKGIAKDDELKGLEIAEYNPIRDEENKTAEIIKDICRMVFK